MSGKTPKNRNEVHEEIKQKRNFETTVLITSQNAIYQ
jgi:hypothetical protein